MGGTIPLWVPFVVAILGLIGTAGGVIAGVVITQRRQMLLARTMGSEDAARTFYLRPEVYIEFYPVVDAQINNFLDNKGYLRRRSTRSTGRSTRSSRCWEHFASTARPLSSRRPRACSRV